MKPLTARHSLAVRNLVLMSMQLAVGQRTPGSALNSPEGADPFRLCAETNLVVLEATVRDVDGGVGNDLGQDAFHVCENGVEQQISYFSRDELPLAVALVVDSSGSMDPVLRQLRRVAYDTLSLLKPGDRVALFDFAARAELQEGLHPHLMHVLLPIYRDVSVEKIARETGGEVIDARSIKDVGPSMAIAISRLRHRQPGVLQHEPSSRRRVSRGANPCRRRRERPAP
jgi:hypothetical protein